MNTQLWESYEEVAAFLLDRFAAHFGLGYVEGKQVMPGAAGTSWEIDAKGIKEQDDAFVVVECKRYTRDRISQEIMAGLAYRIRDLGADGGIVVTTIGLQEGAVKVADHEGITVVHLDAESTRTEYVMRFLNHVCVGLDLKLPALPTIAVAATVTDQYGNMLYPD